jgi:magnesium transporter
MPDEQQLASASLSFETAGEHVLTRVPRASPKSLVEEIRRSLLGDRYDGLTHVAILDGAKLAGILTIETLFSAPKGSVAQEVMDPDPSMVAPGTDQEVAAWQAATRGESALAVVDEEDNFLGFVPPHRLLAVLLWEQDEDMDRLGGFLRSASKARGASREPKGRRFRHRLPWLLVGLVGALLSADLVGAFEEQLKGAVALAFFIPGIVYYGRRGRDPDRDGGHPRAFGRREPQADGQARAALRVANRLGALLCVLPVALWHWGDGEVAVAVSLSLLAACSVATLIAMALP